MLDQYVQQWSAIQTARAAHLSVDDVFLAYSALRDNTDKVPLEGYLRGLLMLPRQERDLVAQAINESLDVTGSTADGAHYSDEDATQNSGYEEYLRTLTLSPDGYDFTAPPVGDHSASTTASGGRTGSGGGASSADHTFSGDGASDEDAVDEEEFRRVQALYGSGLLEGGAEERFDRITRQAREFFGVSSSSIALITEDAQVIKSVTGPLGQDLPRHLSLCAITIRHDSTLVITDASIHPDWQDHPLVAGGPRVRFYAGHPVTTIDGWRIGTICLMDDQPRDFTDDDAQALRRVALQVQRELWA